MNMPAIVTVLVLAESLYWYLGCHGYRYIENTAVQICTGYYPIPPLGEWDLVFVWFHLPYYYSRSSSSSSSSSSKGWSDFTLLLKLSQ